MKFKLLQRLVAVAAVTVLAWGGLASASDVDVAVVDVTTPTNSVTLAAGGPDGTITINMSVTGNQAGTATFEVHRTWTLSNGTFTGSNPQEFTVGPRSSGDPATTFSTTGSVSVASGQADGVFTLAVGVFDITNSNATGAKLAAGDPSSYSVTVEGASPPADTTAPTTTASAKNADDTTYIFGDWTNQDVTVTLEASDNIGGSGVKETRYTTDGSTPSATNGSIYTEPFTISDEGTTTVKYRSIDNRDNLEQTQSKDVKIDKTDPTITPTATTADDQNYVADTWTNQDVTVAFVCADETNGSQIATDTVEGATVSTESANGSVTNTGSCTDNAGNSADPVAFSPIKIDKTKPTITPSGNGYTAGDWTKQDVTVSFACVNDAGLSPLATSNVAGETISDEGVTTSVTNTGECVDAAGNAADATTFGPIKIDKTAPAISFDGGPDAGGVYYFGSGPSAPTCSGLDQAGLSGLTGTCVVSGYSSAVGSHTIYGRQSDVAGNEGSASRSYQVRAWTLKGFYSPVDLDALNVVKGGSTVPLKFEAFAGPTELTALSTVRSFKVGSVSCDNFAGDPTDDIEQYSTGGTTLRYDTTGGQFIQNWQTPKGAGHCLKVTLTLADGSSVSANFKTK